MKRPELDQIILKEVFDWDFYGEPSLADAKTLVLRLRTEVNNWIDRQEDSRGDAWPPNVGVAQ